jgi:Ca-activated chloride channel family protein
MIRFHFPQYAIFYLIFVFMFLSNIYYNRSRVKLLTKFTRETLLGKLLRQYDVRYIRIKNLMLIVGMIFLLSAFIGPQMGTKLVELKRKGVDILIALDTSLSMDAQDIKPSRLERAKLDVNRFIQRLKGDRIGIIAFAGVSYLQCPLTLDYSAARLLLDVIDTKLIPTQGTALADAISTARSTFPTDEKKYKVLIIISDGEDHEGDILKESEAAAEEGIIIYTIGMGTVSGSPIPFSDKSGGGFKKDDRGRVITTHLVEKDLQQIASITGGRYIRALESKSPLEDIYQYVDQLEKRELNTHQFSQYQELYQPILFIALVLFISEIFVPEKRKREEIWRGRFE